MRRLVLSLVVAAIACMPAAALAEGGSGLGVFLYNENVTYAASGPASSPGTSTGIDFWSQGAVVGAGAHYTGALGSGAWSWNILGAAGIGSEQFEQETTSGTFTDKLSLLSYKARLGVDLNARVNDDFGWYCGPGFIYRSTKATLKEEPPTGSSLEEDLTYTEYGLDNRLGSTYRVAEKGELFGDISSSITYGSADKNDDKVTSWNTTFGFRGGYRFLF